VPSWASEQEFKQTLHINHIQNCILFSLLFQPSKNALQELADPYLSSPQLGLSEDIDERGKKSVLSNFASGVR